MSGSIANCPLEWTFQVYNSVDLHYKMKNCILMQKGEVVLLYEALQYAQAQIPI